MSEGCILKMCPDSSEKRYAADVFVGSFVSEPLADKLIR